MHIRNYTDICYFTYVAGNYSLSEIPLNSTEEVLPNENHHVYHEWDSIKPSLFKLREVYHPIFEKYGIDLVLSGHNHNYQRTYPLTYNTAYSEEPKVTNTATSHYDGQKDGIVFAIVGTG